MKALLPLLGLPLLFASCTTSTSPAKPLATEAKVDLKRYTGKWYEIARYPKWFQTGCVSATADYSRNKDGTIRVVNTCLRGDGSSRSIEGIATPVDAKANRLKVSFPNNWYSKAVPVPAEGNYWIIDVSPDYSRAVVGTPDRRSLWFLARSPKIAAKDFESMKAIATAQGFDMSALAIDGHTKIDSRGRATVQVASARPGKTKR
ncbi:lipocalin family protein [Haloferula sp. BvORR071]|uniref:lipocalin family protein n=1 Tax=Haloferula sp. BvORR071 TaxID=1396141 RepID=UPI000696ABAD|nr:lipocalin family protein [Haloferula sp. BvORR071]